MAEPILHRMTDDQLPGVLALLADAGGTARTLESWRHDAMTALLLGPQDHPQAVMPMSRRTLQAAPGREVQVGWLSSNGFAARMGARRQSRQTAARWPELLPELDALVVVRRDEKSLLDPAARWYAQTGFGPVLGIRCLYRDMTEAPAAPSGRYLTRVAGPDELAGWEAQMLLTHRDVFGHFGGPVQRRAGFWTAALAHHFYRQHYQFQVIGLWTSVGGAETLMGYAVVGWSGWHSKRPRMDILELATRQWDAGVAQELLTTASQLAWSKNVPQVRAVVSVHDPYRSHLLRTGFEERWGYVMLARWLHPQRYLDRLLARGDVASGLGETGFRLQPADGVALALGKPTTPGSRVVTVQGDAAAIGRLVLQRLELQAAVHEGSLVALDARDTDLARLAMALPWTPWVFHMLDYI